MSLTKQKGDIAEVFVTFLLKQNGFNVLFPWGEDSRYDLVSEKSGIFKRIQVKYTTPKNGVLEVRIRSCNNFKIIHYSPNDIDIIAAYDSSNRDVYFIPLRELENISSCKLRLTPAKNMQQKHVILAAKYRLRFDLLMK